MIHKFILWCFKSLNNLIQILSITCAFFIMTIVLYWLETVLETQWNWLNFIRPVLNNVLSITNSIFPVTLNTAGTVSGAKFISSIFLFIALTFVLRFFAEQLENLKTAYQNVHIDHKLAEEKSFNQKLVKSIEKEQKKISKYMVLVNTQIKKKFSHVENKINLDEQNALMNKFICEKTGVQHQVFNGNFLYNFDEFDKIDDILDVLFKVLKSNTPLEYEICIQIGDNMEQLKKISELQQYGRIIMCADTVLKYKCKKSHRYGTHCIGVYQKDEGTIEVHEFEEIL